MSPDAAVFWSEHSDVLQAWDNYDAEYEDWKTRWFAAIETWGFDPKVNLPFVTDGVWFPRAVVGVAWDRQGPTRAVPAGWKRCDSSGRLRSVIRPYRAKGKADPAIQTEFNALVQYPDVRRNLIAQGMQHDVHTGSHVRTYAVVRVDGRVWVKWGSCEPEKVDAEKWTRLSLADYYTRVEEGSDPFARKDDDDD